MLETVDNSKKTVNLDYLTDLSKGNTKFVSEMIKIFLTENPEEMKSLEKGIEEGNFDAVKATAHKLRSTIPFVGLDKVIEKEVAEVEALATEKTNMAEIKVLFVKIKKACELACSELQLV